MRKTRRKLLFAVLCLLAVCGLAWAHVKVAVVRSWGPVPVFTELNDNWQAYGNIPLTIDTSLMDASSFTYQDLTGTGADVLWLSDPSGRIKQYSAAQIDAIRRYVNEGHSILGTYVVFQFGSVDNRMLAPIFGLRPDIAYNTTQVPAGQIFDILVSHSVFWNVPDPYVSGGWPNAQVPANDRMWDPVDLGNAQLLARTDDKRGVVTLYQASSYNAIFVSEMIEYQGNSSDTQFLYNALTIGQISEPATIYVDADVPAGGDGSGWADAFNDLQDALAFAKSGDEIRVAQGAYTPEGPLLDIHLATNPNPANGARRVTITAELSWTAGADATSHDVYFGTTSPGMFQGNQSGTTFDPGTMAYSTTYYWRIDELNQGGTTTGTVWSFRTMGPGPSLSPPEGDSNEQAALEVIDREATFQLKNGVVIKGGYAGFGEPNADARDIEAYETILSGDLLGNDEPNFVNYEENSYHVVTGSGTDETAVLDGVTITAGNANGYFAGPTARGGGMYNEYGNPTILNCTFTRNSAGQSGGGICNHISSSPNLTNCTFSRNSTDVYGGGMSNRISSSPALTNCTFSSNSADICGGGMNNYDQSSPTLTNCTFSGNSASRDGGGMYNRDSSSPALTNCKFTGNSAILYGGGGMRNIESNPTLTNCTFNNNSANRGGGISNWLGSPIVSDCTFSSNSAELGGAVLNWQCSPMLANCTFSNNSAGIGGAIYQFNSISTLINCILWGNTAPSGSQIHNDGTSSTEVTYSDVQGGWPGQGNIDADPCFVQLGYWVQPPPGHPGDDIWVEGDYHLLHGSPCINTGDPDYIAEPDETDLDGKPRVIGGRIDMGAYEFNHIPVADAGPDRAVEAQAPWGATVTLDGSGSSDDDSTPGTIDDINDFNWYELDPCDPNVDVFLGSGQIIDCNLSIGEHIFVLEVIDKVGASDTNEVTIIVQDTTPPTITCPSSERIVAYNDCVYRSGDQYIANNVTTYGIGSGFAGSTSGPLVDQVTGDDMDIMITLTESGGVNWLPSPSSGGSDCAIGTDAYNTFGGTADMTGVIYHGSAGWWVDLTFTGLDPTTEYTFATSAARNSYSDRWTIYTLTGADTYTNAGTIGVDVLAENKVRFNTGDNHNEGYVARWTGITATDGSFTVRAEADPCSTDGRKAYSFDVFMLEGVLPGDVTLECPADTTPSATGNATATDTCGNVTITHSDQWQQNCGNAGTLARTWTATDESGNSSTCVQIITVVDTTPPFITCPADVTLQCPADTSVEANGSATAGDTCSSATITHSDQWQPNCGNTGTLARTWTAIDECGNSSSCMQIITVVDTTPPEFEFSVTPTMLWPPDHKMVKITPSWTVSDKCDATPQVSIVSIVANEGDDTIGDGHTSNDIQIGEDGSIYLRSERSGTSSDRIYTITYQAVDDCGNTTIRSATVSIPHDFKVLARIADRWLWAGPSRIPEDLNSDGIVNLKDIAIFANNWIQ